MIRFLALCLLCACASATGPEVPGTEHSQGAQSDPWLHFVDEYCGRWAETVWGPGQEALFIEFFEATRQLAPEQVSDFPLRLLADPEQHGCWTEAARVIGFAGTAEDGERLLSLYQSYPLTQVVASLRQSLTPERLASSTQGLGFLAARLEETHPLRSRIIDYLIACSEPDYWLGGTSPRIFFRAEWRSELTEQGSSQTDEEFKNAAAGHAMRRCVKALGNVGSERVGDYLTAGARGFSWQRAFPPLQSSAYEFALKKNNLIRRFGLEGMIRQGYSSEL